MAPETFTFACPVCNTRLTVPTSLSGVIGPCPSCNTRIQAPELPVRTPEPTPVPPAPDPVPAPPTPVPQAPPLADVTPPPAPPPTPAELKSGYRPEPRQLPTRPEGHEPVLGKPVPEAMREQPEDLAPVQRSRRLIRTVIPLLLLACAISLVYGITSFMKAYQPPPQKADAASNGNSGSTVRKIQPEEELPIARPEPDESAPVAPQPNDPPPPSRSTHLDPSSSPDSKPPATTSALKVLELFLDASNLAERLPLMEGRTPLTELEKSCLNKPLTERLSVEPAMQSDNPVENFTDFIFKVTFAKLKGKKECYDVLVRRRGNQQPKVVTDPFLDLFGGRLLAFAAEPGDNKQGTFQVLVTANKCNDSSIPNYEKKISLKVIGEPTGREIITTYAGRASVIGDMLDNDQSGFGWGRAKACTLLLNWNVKDNPAHPYIEACTIKALNWNP